MMLPRIKYQVKTHAGDLKFIQVKNKLQREIVIFFLEFHNKISNKKTYIILTGNLKRHFVARVSNSYENNVIICA